MKNLILKVIYRIVSRIKLTNLIIFLLAKIIVSNSKVKNYVNHTYNSMGYTNKKIFTVLFSNIFRNKDFKIVDTFWEIIFRHKKIVLPLRNKYLWLDWDLDISITGHDIEVIQTYEHLLNKIEIKCFFDVGTNYGTHSLLFLSQDVKTISFEPNYNCNHYFLEACRINNYNYSMNNIAVGEDETLAKLKFPKNALWNGSLLNYDYNTTEVEEIEVKVSTLDKYIEEKKVTPSLIKIDTEGFEYSVLKGSTNTIKMVNPIIIFESTNFEVREKIYNFFKELDYVLACLPIESNLNIKRITLEHFKSLPSTNLIAVNKNNTNFKFI